MALKPQPLTLETLRRLLDPGRVFYRPAVDDIIKRGDPAEIQATLKGVRDIQTKYRDLEGLANALEVAAKRAQ